MVDRTGTVAVVACSSYEAEEVRAAVRRALALLEFDASALPRGTAFVKPNMVREAPPGMAATTHPQVVGAVVQALTGAGHSVLVGDCPGVHVDEPSLARMLDLCGITRAVEEAGGRVCGLVRPQPVAVDGLRLREVPMAQPMARADMLVSVSKLKTHSLCTMTGAVKNLFGIIPGLQKAELHARFPLPNDFADALIDICLASRAGLHVMDAVVAMEGPGPTAGTPRFLGAILASTDPFALDVVAARLMGLDPRAVATIRRSADRGLISDLNAVATVGDDWRSLVARPPFAPARKRDFVLQGVLGRVVPRTLARKIRLRPVVNPALCTGCRQCYRSCPPHAIIMKDHRPVIDLDACIRCYCCQELCPQHAFTIRRGWNACP